MEETPLLKLTKSSTPFKPALVAHAYNPSKSDPEAGGSEVQAWGYPWLDEIASENKTSDFSFLEKHETNSMPMLKDKCATPACCSAAPKLHPRV